MGGVCGKNKESQGQKPQRSKYQHNSIKINTPPKAEIFTRKNEWIGLKNLHNTCYINSGSGDFISSAELYG